MWLPTLITVMLLVGASHGEVNSFTESELVMNANTTIGSEMFEIENGEGEKKKSIKFGFASIIELDGSGNKIDAEGHYCNFDKKSIDCDASLTEEGTMDGLDEEGNSTSINYKKKTLTCDLDSCNKGAFITISTYIFKGKGYICQPACDDDDMLRSAVFNGTAKWSVELEDWNFCNGTTACGDKSAESLKIFFGLQGKSKGKPYKMQKKDNKGFDSSKCEEMKNKGKGEDDNGKDNGKGNGKDNGKGDSDNGKDNDGGKGDNGKGDNGKGNGKSKRSPDRVPRKSDKGNSTNTARGKCDREARDTSFNGEPEDQDSFKFIDDDTQESSDMVFRLFPVAVLDGDTLVTNETGFVGPIKEIVTEEVGKSGKTRDVEYVTIVVPKFNSSMVYDPTGDMSADGGTAYREMPSSTLLLLPSSLLLAISMFFAYF